MARRVTANFASIMFPPRITPPVELKAADVALVVNTRPVGWSRTLLSSKDDVELIQFYLSEFFDNVPGVLIPVNFPRSKTGQMVTIDGKVGNQTNAAILLYQQSVLGLTSGLGIVTPPTASGPSLVGSGPMVDLASFSQARTALSLSASWVMFNPGKDILASPKLAGAASLRSALTRGIPQPI
jgi:hypothetical protein